MTVLSRRWKTTSCILSEKKRCKKKIIITTPHCPDSWYNEIQQQLEPIFHTAESKGRGQMGADWVEWNGSTASMQKFGHGLCSNGTPAWKVRNQWPGEGGGGSMEWPGEISMLFMEHTGLELIRGTRLVKKLNEDSVKLWKHIFCNLSLELWMQRRRGLATQV